MLIMYLISSPQEQDILSENCRSVVVSKVAMIYSALNKIAKDFSLIVQDSKIESRLKGWEDAVFRDILSILRSISPYLFLFGKYVFMCSITCQSSCCYKLKILELVKRKNLV